MNALQKFTKTKDFKKIVLLAFVALSILFWLGSYIYGKFYVSTDNAYLNANIVQIAPRVTGQVNQLYVSNNEYVHLNQPLFNIDPASFQVAFLKAQAQLSLNEAQLINAQSTANRKFALVKQKFVSSQEGENALAALQTAEAARNMAHALLQQANLDLQWTKITAPTSGWVTNLSLRVGDMTTANQPLFVIISDKEFWVDANFKETELDDIHPGQRVKVTVDMYPSHTFHGVVQSISGGTGSAFSLLPPQNATGNWVKITQRVPVRIIILNPDVNFPLRVGSSAHVRISLHRYLSKN